MSNHKEEINKGFDELIEKIKLHLEDWKKKGGGTTGHSIGSVIERVKELKEYYKNNC